MLALFLKVLDFQTAAETTEWIVDQILRNVPPAQVEAQVPWNRQPRQAGASM